MASYEDLEVSSPFNSSIALKGSFRLVRLLFFFLWAGSSKEEEEDSSELYPGVAGVFSFFFGVSISDSESDLDSEELSFLRLILLKLRNRLSNISNVNFSSVSESTERYV